MKGSRKWQELIQLERYFKFEVLFSRRDSLDLLRRKT